MAKLRRTIGRPAAAKKAAAKPAAKAKPATKAKRAAKAVKKAPAAKPRPAPRPKARARPAARPAVRTPPGHKQKPGRAAPAGARVRPVKAVTPLKPPARSAYAEAVLTYERAMQALQAKRYRDAAHLLKTVIATYPEEKELLERAQLYLRVCERHLTPLDATPNTPEERVYAATLAINAGDTERAVALLTAALTQDQASDRAEYMLGVALAIRGNHAAAITHLERAVALNPETRNLIVKEADLEALRHTDAIAALLSAPPPPVQPHKDKNRRPAGRARGSAR
jgi:tetratricopeptide (TPR) repeat protein